MLCSIIYLSLFSEFEAYISAKFPSDVACRKSPMNYTLYTVATYMYLFVQYLETAWYLL